MFTTADSAKLNFPQDLFPESAQDLKGGNGMASALWRPVRLEVVTGTNRCQRISTSPYDSSSETSLFPNCWPYWPREDPPTLVNPQPPQAPAYHQMQSGRPTERQPHRSDSFSQTPLWLPSNTWSFVAAQTPCRLTGHPRQCFRRWFVPLLWPSNSSPRHYFSFCSHNCIQSYSCSKTFIP